MLDEEFLDEVDCYCNIFYVYSEYLFKNNNNYNNNN